MKSKTFIIVFFAIVAVLAAVSYYFSVTIDKSERSFSAVASRDGKYKAVKFTIQSTGASKFCLDTISVMLTAYPDDAAERIKQYEVYAAPCDAAPKIEWQSDSALQITFAPGAKPPRTKDIDVTKTVHVMFVERK
ncbi:MAG: hypothetical protein ABI830_08180 [Pseudolabrys sp.]